MHAGDLPLPPDLESKFGGVAHYDPLPCGLKKQGINFTCPQLVLIHVGTQCVAAHAVLRLARELFSKKIS